MKRNTNPSGKTSIPLTYKERQLIEKLRKEKFSCSQIALELGRGKNTIISEVRRHSLNGEYKASIAHEMSLEKRSNKYLKIKQKQKGTPPNFWSNLVSRLNNLELQIEILIDTIKELKK